MRLAAVCGLAATPLAAQDLPVFDPSEPYFVQQVMADDVLLESGGRQFLCGIEIVDGALRGHDVILPVACTLFGTPDDAVLAQNIGEAEADVIVEDVAEVSPSQDIADAERIIEGMPPPAFQAALLSVFNDMGCVIDFSNVAETQAEIIANTGSALGFTPEVTEAVTGALDDRIGSEIDAMESRFEIDETAQVATLVDGCEQ